MLSDQETALLEQLLELPFEARQEIAERVTESLSEEECDVPAALRAELHRRITDYESGRSSSVPHEEVMASLRQRHAP